MWYHILGSQQPPGSQSIPSNLAEDMLILGVVFLPIWIDPCSALGPSAAVRAPPWVGSLGFAGGPEGLSQGGRALGRERWG